MGVPTVLVYLGFVGDTGINDVGECFRNDEHWHTAFSAYADSVVPAGLFGHRLETPAAPFWLLVRSRSVLEVSPAARRIRGDTIVEAP
jgi:hypothetical protein